jgi:hypothetical protein
MIMPALAVVDPTKLRLMMAPKGDLASMGIAPAMVSFVTVLKLDELHAFDS